MVFSWGHQTGGQTRTARIGDAATSNNRDRTKQVQILDLLPRFDLASPVMCEGSINFLPRHAVGQHRQRVAQIDHLIQAVTEKVVGYGAAFKNSQETASIEYLFEIFDHPESPHITSIHEGSRGFAGMTCQAQLHAQPPVKSILRF